MAGTSMSLFPIEEPRGRHELSFSARKHRSASTHPSDRSEYMQSLNSCFLTESNLRVFNLFQSPPPLSSTSPDSTISQDSFKGRGMSYTNPGFKYELERRSIFVSKTLPPDWDHISEVVNHGADRELNTLADRIFEAQSLLLDASNEATVVAEVIPQLLPMRSLLLSTSYEGIYDALWKVQDIPTCDGANTRLASPKPDVTVGYNRRFLGFSEAVDFLSITATPVICLPKLAFPIFTLEAKGLESTIFSNQQNMHNGSCMLRNLCHLRSLVNRSCQNLVVFTASVSPEKISLHAHWARQTQFQMTYASKEVKAWSPGSENLECAVRVFANVIYHSLEEHEKWIRQDLQTLTLTLQEQSPISPC